MPPGNGEPVSLENDDLRVDVRAAPDLSLAVTDKRSGLTWESPGPPFSLSYWDARHYEIRHSAASARHGWEFRVLPDEERFTVQCTWPRAACAFRANLRLDGPALDVTFSGRRLVENRPSDVRQMALDVLPGFGGARTGEAGFLFIPRERGALCRFDKSGSHETSLMFYAGGDRCLAAPVFGVAREAGGLLGIVAAGEFDAELAVAANGGPDRDLNYAHTRFRFRLHPSDQLDEGARYQVRYLFFGGKSVSFADMAAAYRQHLVDARPRGTLREELQTRPMLDYARRAVTLHVQLAEKRRTTRMTGDGELMVKTRFAELPDVGRAVKDAGIDEAAVVLVGWNCEGRDGLYPTRFPVESAIGGADAMSQALAALSSLGLQVGALDNHTDMYRRSPAFNEDLGTRQLGGTPWRGGVWAGGESYVICPHQALGRHAQRDMRRLKDLGLEGLLFLDHCPGPGVLRCYHAEHPLTRAEYAQYLQQVIETARETFGICRIAGPSVFAALAADSCMCPVADTPAIEEAEDDWYVDEAVPFLPLALHGLTLLAADADEDPLRAVEYGAAPVYGLSMAEAAHKLPGIASFARRYAAELAPLADAFIEEYETPGEGLIFERYSTGAEVRINRTEEAAEIAGANVPPRDFQVAR
jgi:hypothetical protein